MLWWWSLLFVGHGLDQCFLAFQFFSRISRSSVTLQPNISLLCFSSGLFIKALLIKALKNS